EGEGEGDGEEGNVGVTTKQEMVMNFSSLEEAVMVRELRKDNLPGRIIRGDQEEGGVSSMLGERTLQQLHVTSGPVVLSLRPRRPLSRA
ncbi:unnamed protein product, partial [Discosporangium mesarthrocarpum]